MIDIFWLIKLYSWLHGFIYLAALENIDLLFETAGYWQLHMSLASIEEARSDF